MKLFTALALVAVNTAAAAAANDGAADALRSSSSSLVTADAYLPVYVADDADASSHQNDVIENQAHAADEVSLSLLLSTLIEMVLLSCLTYILLFVFSFSQIEKKNDVPKYLRGIQGVNNVYLQNCIPDPILHCCLFLNSYCSNNESANSYCQNKYDERGYCNDNNQVACCEDAEKSTFSVSK